MHDVGCMLLLLTVQDAWHKLTKKICNLYARKCKAHLCVKDYVDLYDMYIVFLSQARLRQRGRIGGQQSRRLRWYFGCQNLNPVCNTPNRMSRPHGKIWEQIGVCTCECVCACFGVCASVCVCVRASYRYAMFRILNETRLQKIRDSRLGPATKSNWIY